MKIDRATVQFRRPKRTFAAMAGLAVLGIAVLILPGDDVPADKSPPTTIALAVLGDSSSHSYQDSLTFPPGYAERGGAFRARTYQWTEVLARLRGNELNLGPWIRWGRPGPVAWLRGAMGLHAGRTPRKEDYLYNFANSGASCNNLMGRTLQRPGQAPLLVALMNHDPARWRDGVVVIRIGNNDWSAVLDNQARDPKAPKARAAASNCVKQIAAAIRLIHATHSEARILLVGADNAANDPGASDELRSSIAVANTQTALDDFNAQLRALTSPDARIAFLDLGAWFRNLWGRRGPDGIPAYQTVADGGELRVTNTVGDEPNNAILADGHGGLVLNALWTQMLVLRLREAFDLPLTPITDEELMRFVSAS